MALMMGVDYELFWTLNPRKLKPFQKAYSQRQKIKYEEMNYRAWINGLYVQNAIGSAFSKRGKYPDKPFRFNESINEKVSGEKPKSKERVQMEVIAMMWNKQFKDNQKGKNGGEV